MHTSVTTHLVRVSPMPCSRIAALAPDRDASHAPLARSSAARAMHASKTSCTSPPAATSAAAFKATRLRSGKAQQQQHGGRGALAEAAESKILSWWMPKV